MFFNENDILLRVPRARRQIYDTEWWAALQEGGGSY
jgi:hypothetical protein